MEGFDLLGTVEAVLMYGTVVIGAASLMVQGIKLITDVTPSQKDDLFVDGIQKYLVKIVSVLDKIALNQPKKDARTK